MGSRSPLFIPQVLSPENHEEYKDYLDRAEMARVKFIECKALEDIESANKYMMLAADVSAFCPVFGFDSDLFYPIYPTVPEDMRRVVMVTTLVGRFAVERLRAYA